MQYFKNVELAKLQGVSEGAVRRWIEATRRGKLELQLYEHNGKTHVANTAKNMRIIKQLVERGKRYTDPRHRKIVEPTTEFYNLFSTTQILDIISNLEIHRELPRQYNYFGEGARYWDDHTKKLWRDQDEANILQSTIKLLRVHDNGLADLLARYEKVNIIDLGPGNCLPVKEFLAKLLLNKGQSGRYIAVDISEQMLKIAQKNITAWFGDKIKFEGYARDITRDRFDDLIISERIGQDADKVVNLILIFGGTLANFRAPEEVLGFIRSSMGLNDLLMTCPGLDTEEARRYFDFNFQPEVSKLTHNHRLLPDLLNLDESLYEVEQGYDSTERMRHIGIKMITDVTIKFRFDDGEHLVEFNKGDRLLLMRAWHQTALEVLSQFDRCGFGVLQANLTEEKDYLLTLHGVKASPR